MELKLSELVDSQRSLTEVAEVEGVNAVTKYRISKIVRQSKGPLKDFFDARQQLVENVTGKKEDEKDLIIIPGTPEHKKFKKEVDALLNEVVKIEVSPVKLSHLLEGHIKIKVQDGDVQRVERKEITAAHLADLDWMIEMDLEGESVEEDKSPTKDDH